MAVTISGSGTISGVPGSILQVASASASSFTSSSTSFVDVPGASVTITPSSTSSKILIMAATSSMGANGIGDVIVQIVANGTAIAGGAVAFSYSYPTASNQGVPGSAFYLDSPNTTSAVTYKLQARTTGAAFRIGGRYDGSINGLTTITLMEVAA